MRRSRPPAPRRPRPRGIALLMSLAVVMLLTFFMSEYFFATGLDLRGMTTFKDSQQARMLSRSVFRAVQIGLLQDEVDFFKGYDQASKLLSVASIPWNNGLLVELQVTPQDNLFNLNQNYRARPDEPQDRARRQVFMAIMGKVQVPSEAPGAPAEPLSLQTIQALYAAINDWIDGDDEEYLGFPSVRGAEADAYIATDVPYEIKNGMLDRLEELRLVRGVPESRIPWGVWQSTFTALPYQSEPFYFTERINVNIASRDAIANFVAAREVDPNLVGANQELHKGINNYAERADELADFFAPADAPRTIYSKDTLQAALRSLGFTDNYGANYLFSTVDEYYRIHVVTEVNGVQARLEAMLQVPRDPNTRLARGVPKLLWETVN